MRFCSLGVCESVIIIIIIIHSSQLWPLVSKDIPISLIGADTTTTTTSAIKSTSSCDHLLLLFSLCFLNLKLWWLPLHLQQFSPHHRSSFFSNTIAYYLHIVIAHRYCQVLNSRTPQFERIAHCDSQF